MIQALKFGVTVSNGDCEKNIMIDADIADNIPNGKILSTAEAVGMGIVLDASEAQGGETPWLGEKEMLRLRRMNAISNNELKKDEDGNPLIPTMETLRKRQRNPEVVLGLIFYDPAYPQEPIPKQVLPNVPDQLLLPMVKDTELSPVCGVYKPCVPGTEQYQKMESAQLRDFPSSKAAEKITIVRKMIRHNGQLYLFMPRNGYYERLNNERLKVMIDGIVGREIRTANMVKAYAEIEKFVCYDEQLEETSDTLLPAGYWAFMDGVVNSASGELICNDGRFFIRSALQCKYSNSASCAIFDSFLAAVTGEDQKLLELVWQVLGYILSPDNSAKAFFVFVGPKDTGKSLLANILIRFFPRSAVSFLSATDFAGRFDVAEIEGTQLNVCMDASDTSIPTSAVGKIKSLTGGDEVRSDVKYREAVSFRNTAKILFCTNTLLRAEVPDRAFEDRKIVIPFRYPVPKEHQDKRLEDKLSQELQGIANKAMSAYRRLVASNYIFPQVDVPEVVGRSFDYEKIISDFANEVCSFGVDARISTEQLFTAFEDFCMQSHVPHIEKSDFSARFSRLFAERVTKNKIKFGTTPLQGFCGVSIKVGDDKTE